MKIRRAVFAGGAFGLVIVACGGGHHDQAPIPVIVLPHENQSFLAGTVNFDGRATDAEDGVLPPSALRWQINDKTNTLAGAFQGTPGQLNFAAKGDYTAYLFAKDSKGMQGVTSVPMHIADTIAVLTNPDNRSLLDSATPFNLDGHAETQALGAQIVSMEFIGTNEDTNAQIFDSPVIQAAMQCNGAFTICNTRVTPSVPAGHIKLRLIAKTNLATEKAEDILHVTAGQAPLVTITAPLDGSQVSPSTPISFSATVTNPNGGAITYTWSDSIDGTIGTQLAFSHAFSDVAKHVVTLSAVDSLGFTGSSSVNLYIQSASNPLFVKVASLPDTNVFSLARQDNGAAADTIWVGGFANITSVAADTAAKGAMNYPTTGTRPAAAALVGASGRRLFGLLGNSVDVLSSAGTPTLSNFVTQDPNVHAVAQLPSAGSFLFGTDNGIEAAVAALTGTTTVFANGPLGARVLSLAVDPTGTVYAGTDQGLYRVTGLPGAANASQISNIASNVVLSLALDGNELWAGTDNGLSRINLMTGTVTSWVDPLPGQVVASVAVDAGKIVWVGTDQGAARFDPVNNRWTKFSATGGTPDLAGRYVSSVVVDKAGAKWFACSPQGAGGGGGGGAGGLTRYIGK